MRRKRRPIAYKRGLKKVTGTLSVVMLSPPEVDWHQHFEDDDELLFVYQENESGDRYRLPDWTILSIGSGYEAEGETVYEIEWEALDHKKEG